MLRLHPVQVNTQHRQRCLRVGCRVLQQWCRSQALLQQTWCSPSRPSLAFRHSSTWPPQHGQSPAQSSVQHSRQSSQERLLPWRRRLRGFSTRPARSGSACRLQRQLSRHCMQHKRTPRTGPDPCNHRCRIRQRLQCRTGSLGQPARRTLLILLAPSSAVLLPDTPYELRRQTACAQDTASLSRRVRQGCSRN